VIAIMLLGSFVLEGGCEPSYDGTAFRCDATHGCPDDQSCIAGRCRRKAGAVVGCGARTCAADQQCCTNPVDGDRCLAADDVCPGDSALCDDPTDCAAGERCCTGSSTLTACAKQCTEQIACAKDEDCPGDVMHCCPLTLRPWKGCSPIPCS
jgi:hypothetical protein